MASRAAPRPSGRSTVSGSRSPTRRRRPREHPGLKVKGTWGYDQGAKRFVRAAGGVVMRGPSGKPEILVVHRPRYDDWTLPKGKAKPGESDEACALREVEEETGFRCAAEHPAGTSTYVDHQGRDKTVRYWTMRPVGGRFHPSHEVDELRWVSLSEADGLLTYRHDRGLLRAFTPKR